MQEPAGALVGETKPSPDDDAAPEPSGPAQAAELGTRKELTDDAVHEARGPPIETQTSNARSRRKRTH